MPRSPSRTQKLDIRLTPQAKQTLAAAAASAHRSVSEFVLDSALASAEETLAGRRSFELDDERWSAFLEALDAPPRVNPRLGQLLAEPSVFERGEAD
jgi:uncharacterized protein (DUF1778 family)